MRMILPGAKRPHQGSADAAEILNIVTEIGYFASNYPYRMIRLRNGDNYNVAFSSLRNLLARTKRAS
jgi:hypothetical protein